MRQTSSMKKINQLSGSYDSTVILIDHYDNSNLPFYVHVTVGKQMSKDVWLVPTLEGPEALKGWELPLSLLQTQI